MRFLTVFLIFYLASPALAGNTVVFTDELHPMTDERNLSVIITFKAKDLGTHGIVFRCFEGTPAVGIKTGLHLHVGAKIGVQYRFDKEPAIIEQFTWMGGQRAAVKFEGGNMLNKALESNKLLVQVDGRKLMDFDLVAAREKLQQLNEECAAWN